MPTSNSYNIRYSTELISLGKICLKWDFLLHTQPTHKIAHIAIFMPPVTVHPLMERNYRITICLPGLPHPIMLMSLCCLGDISTINLTKLNIFYTGKNYVRIMFLWKMYTPPSNTQRTPLHLVTPHSFIF